MTIFVVVEGKSTFFSPKKGGNPRLDWEETGDLLPTTTAADGTCPKDNSPEVPKTRDAVPLV